jgi:hypothetical protein
MTSKLPAKRNRRGRRVLKAGIVAFNDRHSTLPCVVRRISAHGATIEVDGSIAAPDTFDLIVELDGLEASCRVIKRNNAEIVAEFLSAPSKTTPKRVQVVKAYAPKRKPSLRRKRRSRSSIR